MPHYDFVCATCDREVTVVPHCSCDQCWPITPPECPHCARPMRRRYTTQINLGEQSTHSGAERFQFRHF